MQNNYRKKNNENRGKTKDGCPNSQNAEIPKFYFDGLTENSDYLSFALIDVSHTCTSLKQSVGVYFQNNFLSTMCVKERNFETDKFAVQLNRFSANVRNIFVQEDDLHIFAPDLFARSQRFIVDKLRYTERTEHFQFVLDDMETQKLWRIEAIVFE